MTRKSKANNPQRPTGVAVKRVVRPRPSNVAITVKEDVTWFYERRGSIEIIHWCKDASGKNTHASHINVPWKILMAAARRCRPEEVA